MEKRIAKIVRIVTIPPLMVFALLLFLYFLRDDVFSNIWQLIFAVLFLGIAPILAYPISYTIPQLKKKGRDAQRNLAIVLSFFGYAAGLLYAIFADVKPYLFVVFLTYFLSIVILIFLNRVVKLKASGHACSIAGPLTLVVYFVGIVHLIWCVALVSLVIWSSLKLKRHTFWQLICGSLTSIVAFFISLLIVF